MPMDADPESCRRFQLVADGDLNHDGVPDFAFVADLPSNRYSVVVSEGRVYLSDSGRRTYCYAPRVSQLAAQPAVSRGGSDPLRRLVDAEVARLGSVVLDCWPGDVADGGGSLRR
jgi:hypothetical protein